MSLVFPTERRLKDYTMKGYHKGRGFLWQASWHAVSNLVFMKWWLPVRFRPAILRAFGAQLGEGVYIRHNVHVHWPWKLTIGNHSWIGEDSWLLSAEPIVIGDDVCISQGAFLCTGAHDFSSPTFDNDNGPITIEKGAWVAARAIVLRGVTVGEFALVPCAAKVTKDVPASTIAGARPRSAAERGLSGS